MTRPKVIALLLSVSLTACPQPATDDGGDDGSETSESDGTSESDSTGDTGALTCELQGCVQQISDCPSSQPCEPSCTPLVDGCEAELLCPHFIVNLAAYAGNGDTLANADAARCFLAALRDGTPGRLEILWGDPQGYGLDGSFSWDAQIYSPGDGTVAITARWSMIDAGGVSEQYFASEAMALQDTSYFETCAVEQDEAALIACLAHSNPSQWDIDELPWLTGACTAFAGCN